MTKEQIEAIFEKFDNNGDGKMSKKEFKQLMALSKKGGVGVEQSPTGRKENNNFQCCLPHNVHHVHHVNSRVQQVANKTKTLLELPMLFTVTNVW